MLHKFQVVMVDGEALGAMEFAVPNWRPGNVIYRGDLPNLRVVEVRPAEPPGLLTILVVEET